MAERISLDFGSIKNSDLYILCLAVISALTGNPKYPTRR